MKKIVMPFACSFILFVFVAASPSIAQPKFNLPKPIENTPLDPGTWVPKIPRPSGGTSQIQVVTEPFIDENGIVWSGSSSGGGPGRRVGKARIKYKKTGRVLKAYWYSNFKNDYGTAGKRRAPKHDKNIKIEEETIAIEPEKTNSSTYPTKINGGRKSIASTPRLPRTSFRHYNRRKGRTYWYNVSGRSLTIGGNGQTVHQAEFISETREHFRYRITFAANSAPQWVKNATGERSFEVWIPKRTPGHVKYTVDQGKTFKSENDVPMAGYVSK